MHDDIVVAPSFSFRSFKTAVLRAVSSTSAPTPGGYCVRAEPTANKALPRSFASYTLHYPE